MERYRSNCRSFSRRDFAPFPHGHRHRRWARSTLLASARGLTLDPSSTPATSARRTSCRTSPPRRSGSSTCSSRAAPSQMDLFDHKPKLAELRGTELPDSIRKGQRLTGMTVDADELPGRAEHVQVRPARQERAPGSANCCRTRRRSPTSCASSSRCTPRRSTTTRRSRSSRPAPSSPGRPSIGAWLAYGLGSENHDLPAFVVHDLARHRQRQRPAAVRPPLGQRLPAVAAIRA